MKGTLGLKKEGFEKGGREEGRRVYKKGEGGEKRQRMASVLGSSKGRERGGKEVKGEKEKRMASVLGSLMAYYNLSHQPLLLSILTLT